MSFPSSSFSSLSSSCFVFFHLILCPYSQVITFFSSLSSLVLYLFIYFSPRIPLPSSSPTLLPSPFFLLLFGRLLLHSFLLLSISSTLTPYSSSNHSFYLFSTGCDIGCCSIFLALYFFFFSLSSYPLYYISFLSFSFLIGKFVLCILFSVIFWADSWKINEE